LLNNVQSKIALFESLKNANVKLARPTDGFADTSVIFCSTPNDAFGDEALFKSSSSDGGIEDDFSNSSDMTVITQEPDEASKPLGRSKMWSPCSTISTSSYEKYEAIKQAAIDLNTRRLRLANNDQLIR
jgi:hypothetical protein